MTGPGQDSRYWTEGAIFEARCPECGTEVEFFKDDTTRRCRKCGHKFVNPKMDFGCASYCRFAEQCIGNLPPELIAQKEHLLKDRVAIEMKRYFGKDFKRIGHAMRVARYAERIAKEEQADLAVVLAAAYLHDIGIPEAERKHGSSAARYQETEGPPVAAQILEGLGAGPALVEEVKDIVAHHHHPREGETKNFKCLYDADLIANLEENRKEGRGSDSHLDKVMETRFLTEAGKSLAREVLKGETT